MMNPHRSTKGTGNPVAIRHRVEVLEGRLCPSCGFTLSDLNTNLLVQGDQRANVVEISDNGAGAISVTCDGVARPAFTGIDTVVVRTGNGNDKVVYTLTGNLTTARSIDIALGNGLDRADLTFGSAVAARDIGQNLSVKVDGGNAKDTVNAGFSINLLANASVNLDLQGGEGSDVVTAQASVGTADSTSKLHAHVLGGNGPDNVTLNANGAGLATIPASALDLILDGGLGPDKCTATSNVTKQSC